MNETGTIMLLTNSLVFLLIGFTIMTRLREAKGSLRLAKISIAMTTFSAAAAFLMSIVEELVYDPLNAQSSQLVGQLFIPTNFFAMLVLAFLASFAVFATYNGGKRKLAVLLIFLVALVPTAYLSLTCNQIIVGQAPPDYPVSYVLTLPPLTLILFALCGIPLGVIPLAAFGRSFITARRRGDKVLGRRAAMMLSSYVLNATEYLVYAFSAGISTFVVLATWIPIALFLLFAVLRITSPVEPRTWTPMRIPGFRS